MPAQIHTIAFLGIETIVVSVQIHIASAHIRSDQFDQQIMMDDAAQDWLRTSMNQVNLLARTYQKIMRVSRMIADLVVYETVGRAAISEALAYRVMPLLA